jgi:hypothetical protein
MKRMSPYLLGPLFVVLSSPLVGAAEQDLAQLDLGDVVVLLTKAESDFPDQASELWQQDDGLPAPGHAKFADTAARFIDQHPVTPAHDHGRKLWDVDKTASRQLKCLAYLAAGKQNRRRDIAALCAAQAMRLLWAFSADSPVLARTLELP